MNKIIKMVKWLTHLVIFIISNKFFWLSLPLFSTKIPVLIRYYNTIKWYSSKPWVRISLTSTNMRMRIKECLNEVLIFLDIYYLTHILFRSKLVFILLIYFISIHLVYFLSAVRTLVCLELSQTTVPLHHNILQLSA